MALINNAARLLARGLYDSVEVVATDVGWTDRPTIVVANHFAGFADPALVLGLTSRRLRFLAKATLWSSKPVGWLLDVAGAVPVYRAQDGSTTANVDTFAACYEVLGAGGAIAIFPEGITHDSPSLQRVRTGAARIALGARSTGVGGLLMLPVGLDFEDKAAIRSRAYVRVGDPIDLDTEIAAGAIGGGEMVPENREAVRILTDRIGVELRSAAPEYESIAQEQSLGLAAAATLRGDDPVAVSYADQQRLARVLARLPQTTRGLIEDEAADYHDGLAAAQLTDPALAAGASGSGAGRHLLAIFVTALLVPYAVAGLILNIVPYLLMKLVTRARVEAVTMATIRVLAGAVLFGLTWLGWAIWAGVVWGLRAAIIVLLLAPLYGGVAVHVVDRVVSWWRAGRSRVTRRRPRTVDALEQNRARVISLVEEALAP